MKKTKLICNIGPSSSSIEMLRKLIEAGMDVARFDLGKLSYTFCEETVEKIRGLESELEKTIGIMFDNRGIELRIGTLANGKAFLQAGREIEIWTNSVVGSEDKFSIAQPKLLQDIKVGMKILLTSGKVMLKVIAKEQEYFVAVVEQEGFIFSHDTVHIPKINLSDNYLDMKNREDIRFAIKENIDFLALSFVRSSNDILDVTDLLIEEGNDHIQLIAKIENELCLEDLDRMIELSDGIMIARGDLGQEMPLEKLPFIQKKVLKRVREVNKLGIVSTDMLASMINEIAPTRAEVSDVYNAVIDCADAVCLNLETSVGNYPKEATTMIVRILMQAEEDSSEEIVKIPPNNIGKDITASIAYSARLTADSLQAKAIIVPTETGYTAKKLSKLRPNCPILALSEQKETVRSLTLHYGVEPRLMYHFTKEEEFISFYQTEIKQDKLAKKGECIIVLGAYPKKSSSTNMLRVEEW